MEVGCEDGLLLTSNFIGILDGATPIDIYEFKGYETQACWFVNEFINKFSKFSCLKNDIENICIKICEQLNIEFDLNVEEYNKPISTVVVLELKGNNIVFNHLSDCHSYVRLKTGKTLHFTDERICNIAKKTIHVSIEKYESDKNRKEAIKSQKIKNREMLNIDKGYFALSLDNKWKGNFIKNSVEVSMIDRILICSDGYNRLFDEYELLTIDEFLNHNQSLLNGLKLLREFEKNETTNKCVKKSDDAAAMLVLF